MVLKEHVVPSLHNAITAPQSRTINSPRDGQRWVSCRPGFFLSVRVLSRLFRRLFLERLATDHATGRRRFFCDHARLAERRAGAAYLTPLRKAEWVVYSKRPFGGPEAVLAYLSLYTHRIAISNSRLVAFDDSGKAEAAA